MARIDASVTDNIDSSGHHLPSRLAPAAGSVASLAIQADDRGLAYFRPVRIRKASDEVLAVLADAIRGGLYRPGDRLPRERDLATRLGVSRPVVREAIEILRTNGVVSVRRGQSGGSVVASLSNLSQVISHIQGETRENIRSLLEMRQILELPAALLAAERATKSDFETLRALVDMLEGLVPEPEEFYQADVQFHLAVADASGNRPLAEALRQTFNGIAAVREQYPHARVELRRAISNQRKMLAAIESGKTEMVRKAVHEHIRSVAEVFLGEDRILF